MKPTELESQWFSSFSADVCLCLAMKQSLYPVFQLTNGDTGFYTDYRDTRVRKMGTASSFAKVYNFTGIVTLVNELLENQGEIKLDIYLKTLII